jgi:hypothetical protein
MVGPALFVVAFTIEGWMRPGYTPSRMFVSELSLGPSGYLQIANFVVFGVLFLTFTRAVAGEFRQERASRAGTILLTIIGACYLLSGPFVMDPATTPPDQMSWHGKLHAILGGLAFSLSPVSCFVFARQFRIDPRWRSFRISTIAAAVLITATIVLWKILPARPTAAPNVFNGWVGIFQRVALTSYLAWVFAFAMRIRRQTEQ